MPWPFLHSFSLYSYHLFLIFSASFRFIIISVLYCAHLCMKCSLGISDFLEEISSLSHSIIFLYLIYNYTHHILTNKWRVKKNPDMRVYIWYNYICIKYKKRQNSPELVTLGMVGLKGSMMKGTPRVLALFCFLIQLLVQGCFQFVKIYQTVPL